MKKNNVKMRKTLVMLLVSVLAVCGLCSCGKKTPKVKSFDDIVSVGKDFRNSKIGDGIEEVKSAENIELTKTDEELFGLKVTYLRASDVTIHGLKADLEYYFVEGKLRSGTIVFKTKSKDELINNFKECKEHYVNELGAPLFAFDNKKDVAYTANWLKADFEYSILSEKVGSKEYKTTLLISKEK